MQNANIKNQNGKFQIKFKAQNSKSVYFFIFELLIILEKINVSS